MRMVKSGNPAASDPLLQDVRAVTDRFLGHVRYASNRETVRAENSHPFQALGVTLAHNGTFYGKIGAEGDARKVSDTVVFLETLADRWMERTLPGLAESLRGILADPGLVGEYSAANLLVAADGRLFAFRRYRRDEGYYTLYLKSAGGITIVASQPLDADPAWRLLEDGELVELSPGAPRSALLAGLP
jgi:predicted glutamine amidotransferase